MDLPIPAPQPVLSQDPNDRVSGGDVARSASYEAQGADKLATGFDQMSQGLDRVAVPLAEQAGQDAVAKAITRNPDGSLNVTTPASSFILGKAGDAYADTVLAGTGAALRSKMDADFANMRQVHEGDAAAFSRAAGSYIDGLAANNPGPIGAMVQQYGNGVAVQTRDGIINQKARVDVQGALTGQQGRIDYISNALNGLAAGAGLETPQGRQMMAERSALQDAMQRNPLSGYSAQQRDNDNALLEQNLGVSAAVGHGRRIYEQSGNLPQAIQATQDDLKAVGGLSEGQQIKAIGEVSAHLRGLDATRQQDNQEAKDQADVLIERSKGGDRTIPQTQFESVAQQLESRRLYAAAGQVRAQGLWQSYSPAIVGGTAQEATDALRKVAGAAAGGADPDGQPLTGPGAANSAYLHRLAQIESGGDPKAVSSTGAKGVYQFTSGTWARYGQSGDPTNLADATAAVVRLTNDNAAALRRSLGRDPTSGELYLAHQQGAAGAAALLSNPSGNAAQALSVAYGGDIGKAYNAIVVNGGDPDGTAGQFASKWIGKFQGGGGPAGGSNAAPIVAYSALLRETQAAYNLHAQQLWSGMAAAYDKGFAPTPAETADLRTMAPFISDPTLRQQINTRLQVEAGKDTFAKIPLAQQQDALAAGDLLGQQGGADPVQRNIITALHDQVKTQTALAKGDPVSYAQRYIAPDARQGLPPVALLDMSGPQQLAAGIKARQAVKGAAQKMDPGVGDMPFTPADKNRIVGTLQQGNGAQAAAVLNTISTTLKPAETDAVLADKQIVDAVSGMSRSNDPAKMNAAFGFMDTAYRRNPQAFDGQFGAGAFLRLRTWQDNVAFKSPEEAAAAMKQADDPNMVRARDALGQEADEALKKVTPSDVVGKFQDRPGWFASLATLGAANVYSNITAPAAPASEVPAQTAQALRMDYAQLYREGYQQMANPTSAERYATERLGQKWGVSQINNNRVMAYPPEAYYQQVDSSHDYIGKQLDQAVKRIAGPGAEAYEPASLPSGYGLPSGINPETLSRGGGAEGRARGIYMASRALVPDLDTQAEIASHQPPGYQVIVLAQDGRMHALETSPGVPFRFHADTEAALAESRAAFTAQREQNRQAVEAGAIAGP